MPSRYSLGAIILHWAIAIAVNGLVTDPVQTMVSFAHGTPGLHSPAAPSSGCACPAGR